MAAFVSLSGASSYFLGGMCTYHLDQKVKFLGVNRDHAAETNCVSDAIVKEMARGIVKLYKSRIGIAASGYVEPFPARSIMRPYVYVCLYDSETDKCHVHMVINEKNSTRVEFQREVGQYAHEMYWRYIGDS